MAKMGLRLQLMEMDRLRRAMVVRILKRETISKRNHNSLMTTLVLLIQGHNRVAVL